MKIAIYGSRRQEPYLQYIRQFFDALAQMGDEVILHSKIYDYLWQTLPEVLPRVSRVVSGGDFDADVVACIGGDGSFLRTAAWVADKEIPIIGINTGHLGYMSSIAVEDLPGLPQLLRHADMSVEERSLVAVDCPGITGWQYALNEVAITKGDGASIINIHANIDGCELATYRSDGLLIATPTGSTAYNLSVGGPIVQPSAPVFVLSPIAAHSLSMRPLVVADNARLSFTCESRARNFRIALDGRSYAVDLGTAVGITRAPFVVKVLMAPGSNFAHTLRNKLAWG